MVPVFADIIGPGPVGDGSAAATFVIGVVSAVDFGIVFIFARKIYRVASTFGQIAASAIFQSLLTLGAVFVLGAALGTPIGLIIAAVVALIIEVLIIKNILNIATKQASVITLAANTGAVIAGTLLLLVGAA